MPKRSSRPVIRYTPHAVWIRPALIGGGIAAAVVCGAAVTAMSARDLAGRPFSTALVALAGLCAFVGPTMLVHVLLGRYRPYRAYLWLVAGVWAAGSVPLTYDLVSGAVAPWPALTVAVAAAVALFPLIGRHIRRQATDRLARMTLLAPGGDTRRLLADVARVRAHRLNPEQEQALLVAEARVWIAGSAADVGVRQLLRAVEALSSVVAQPTSNPLIVFLAAVELTEAFEHRHTRHGDLSGYPQALEVLGRAAEPVQHVPGALAVLEGRRGGYHAALASEAPPGTVDHANAERAARHLRAAIAATPTREQNHLAGLHLMLAGLLYSTGPDRLDEALDLCRAAYRLLRRKPWQRAIPASCLAQLLVERAAADDAVDAEGDLRTAAAYCEQAMRWAPRGDRWRGLELAASVQYGRWLLDGDDDLLIKSLRSSRLAFHAAHAQRASVRARIALDWALTAEVTGVPEWCAEPYRHLLALLPYAVATRHQLAKKHRYLAGTQGWGANAGYWLAKAGEPRAAAVAMESGRGVVLMEAVLQQHSGTAPGPERTGPRSRRAVRTWLARSAWHGMGAPVGGPRTRGRGTGLR